MNEEKRGPSPKELAIIVGAVVAVGLAIFVIVKTINASRPYNAIEIKGVKGGAKPQPGSPEYTQSSSGLGGASDRPFPTNESAPRDASDRPFPGVGSKGQPIGAKGQ
jgi:hypothetical protein